MSPAALADPGLVLSTKAQMRVEGATVEREDTGTVRFFIPRAQVNADGRAFDAALRYRLSIGLSDTTAIALRDLYANGVLVPGVAEVRVGRFKRPFNRQFITSAYATELAEKAPTLGFSGSIRDNGVMLHNGYDRSPEGLEWAFGAFNGRIGSGQASQTALVARLGWNFGDIDGYSEGDPAGGPLRLAVAASGLKQRGDDTLHELEIDAIAKVDGFDVSGAFFLRLPESPGGGQQAETGFHIQAGAFVVARRLLLAGRYASIPATTTGGRRTETRGALSYYLDGEALKLQAECGLVEETGSARTEQVELRAQVQLVM